MVQNWFKRRRYRHFDAPVNEAFAQRVQDPKFVAKHSFSPLIHYTKEEKRYKISRKTGQRRVAKKERPIKYASHRDSCVLTYYAYLLNNALTDYYEQSGFNDSVIAYRALGRSNYDFSAEAYSYAKQISPAMVLAFDVSSFFDQLDHFLLKRRLKTILRVNELSKDWYNVFRTITKFHYVDIEELKAHPHLGLRLIKSSRDPIASVAELKAAGITFHPNPELSSGNRRGIPQGTPISAVASNLYMMDFDAAARSYCESIGALYRRYSDDILIICRPEDAQPVEDKILTLINAENLQIQSHKTEKTLFAQDTQLPRTSRAAQYLGFTLSEDGAAIREASLARQWRRMRRAFRHTIKVAEMNMKEGNSSRIFTRRLRRRFTYLNVFDGTTTRTIRNFSSYARRSADSFGKGEKITKQIKKFEKAANEEFKKIKSLNSQKGKHLP